MQLNRDSILAMDDLVIEKVELQAPYDGCVYIKSMTGVEWDSYQDLLLDAQEDGSRKLNLRQAKVKLLVHCLCDEAGNLLFSKEDIPLLAKKSNKFLEQLGKVAQSLNGMSQSEEKKEKN